MPTFKIAIEENARIEVAQICKAEQLEGNLQFQDSTYYEANYRCTFCDGVLDGEWLEVDTSGDEYGPALAHFTCAITEIQNLKAEAERARREGYYAD